MACLPVKRRRRPRQIQDKGSLTPRGLVSGIVGATEPTSVPSRPHARYHDDLFGGSNGRVRASASTQTAGDVIRILATMRRVTPRGRRGTGNEQHGPRIDRGDVLAHGRRELAMGCRRCIAISDWTGTQTAQAGRSWQMFCGASHNNFLQVDDSRKN